MNTNTENKLTKTHQVIKFASENILLSIGIGLFLIIGFCYILTLSLITLVAHPFWVIGSFLIMGLIKYFYKNGNWGNFCEWYCSRFEITFPVSVISCIAIILGGTYYSINKSLKIQMEEVRQIQEQNTFIKVEETDFSKITNVQFLPTHNVITFESGNTYLVQLTSMSVGQKARIETWKNKAGQVKKAIYIDGWGCPQYLIGE